MGLHVYEVLQQTKFIYGDGNQGSKVSGEIKWLDKDENKLSEITEI